MTNDIAATCAVNVSYPTNNGCTLQTNGRMRINWVSRVKPNEGLVVNAIWEPLKASRGAAVVDHQATWIASLSR